MGEFQKNWEKPVVIKFGNNFIRLKNILSITAAVNPNWKYANNDPNNTYYYMITVTWIKSDSINYYGNANDLYEFMLKADELGYMNGVNIPSFKEFVKHLEKEKIDWDSMKEMIEAEENKSKHKKRKKKDDDKEN